MNADRFDIVMTEARGRLMVLDATAGIGGIRRARELVIRQLAPHEAAVHARVAAAAFGGPAEAFLPSPELIRLDGARCYVGEVAGQPVATALGVTAGEFSVILNVATVPWFRRRGFGTAVTARAVGDGILAGAAWCWLEASEEGYPVFRNLGFRPIEKEARWVPGEQPPRCEPAGACSV
jgi:N-acetylglutamate synthase